MGQSILSALSRKDIVALSMLNSGTPVYFDDLAMLYECDVREVGERVNRIAVLCDLQLNYQGDVRGHA